MILRSERQIAKLNSVREVRAEFEESRAHMTARICREREEFL